MTKKFNHKKTCSNLAKENRRLKEHIIELTLEVEALNETIRQQAEKLMDLSDSEQVAAASLIILSDIIGTIELQEQTE